MNTIIKLLALIIGLQYISATMSMNYCNQTGGSPDNCGIWEAQLITYGLTTSAFAYCAWSLCKNYGLEQMRNKLLARKRDNKRVYPVRVAINPTRGFKK